MLLKGQIVAYRGNKYDVRIPSFETAGNPNKYILAATLAYQPGSEKGLLVGDIVIVGFENNDAGSPIILGKLYLGGDSPTASGKFWDLKVSGAATFSKNFNVGELSYEDLMTSQVKIDEHEKQLKDLNNRPVPVTENIEASASNLGQIFDTFIRGYVDITASSAHTYNIFLEKTDNVCRAYYIDANDVKTIVAETTVITVLHF